VEVEVHSYLTQASDEGVWSADVLAALLLRKEHLLHIRVGPALDELDMRKKSLSPAGIEQQFPGNPAHTLATNQTTLFWLSVTSRSSLM